MPEAQAFTDLQSASKRVVVRAAGAVGIVPPAVGAVDTGILLWGEVPVVTGSVDLVTAENNANLGTRVILRAPGIYCVEFYVEVISAAGDAANPVFGVSQDVEIPDGLVDPATFADTGYLDVTQPFLNVVTTAGMLYPQKLTSWFEVTDTQANQVVGGVTGSIIRFHSSEPVGGQVLDTAYYQVRRIRDAYAA